MDRLATYVAAWKSCAADVEELLLSLDEDDWSRETDCPGWTVRDITAHIAALESELAGDPGPEVDRAELADTGANLSAAYTQAGIDERRDRTPHELIDEFTDAVRRRAAQIDADPPRDPKAKPAHTPGGVDWDQQTLLRNRVVDLWVHEQDIRRAVDRPGDLQTPAAEVVTDTLLSALPYVIAKRAGAEAGTTVLVVLDDRQAAFEVNGNGRCKPVDDIPASPTVRLQMDTETLAILGAGRRDPLTVEVAIGGDRSLAERIVQELVVIR
jgi:uncharacterized protein (TIGR03083 family)